MSAVVLAALDRHVLNCAAELVAVQQRFIGSPAEYARELADARAWHQEAIEARAAAAELLQEAVQA